VRELEVKLAREREEKRKEAEKQADEEKD